MPGAGVRQHHIEIFKRKYKIGFMIKDKKKKEQYKTERFMLLEENLSMPMESIV